MKAGDKVTFGRTHGEKTLGTVVKVNRTTVVVRQDEARGTMRDYPIGTKWKVPFKLCAPVGGAAPAAEPEPKRPAVKVGTEFHAPLADGNPLWRVTRRLGGGAWEAVVVNEPAEINGRVYDSDFAGTKRAFRSQDIVASLAMDAMFAGIHKAHEDFYAGLKPGAIVHYDNGFCQYVRCEAVKVGGENQLRPIALVGNWKGRDVDADSYYPRMIEAGKLFKPNASNICENPTRAGKGENPAALEPIRLVGQQLALGVG